MILVSCYYLSDNIERQKELNDTLIYNANNKYIKQIILLNDNIYNLNFIKRNKKKIKQVSLYSQGKLYFSKAIEYINQNLCGENIILSNSDIYFDNSLELLVNKFMEKKVYCLLRYEILDNGKKDIFRHFDEPRSDSQDSWIFKSPLDINLEDIHFTFGTLGCDNIFANVLYNHGYQLYNPAYDIITTHKHQTAERTYQDNERIHGNYCLIKPDHLDAEAQIRFMNY